MGENDRNEKQSSVITCGLCFSVLSNPVTFSCRHSYCASCVHGHLDTGVQKPFVCLLCGSVDHKITINTVPGMVNSALRDFVQSKVEGIEKRLMCQWCEEVVAVVQCQECKRAYCTECNFAVHKSAAKRGHRSSKLSKSHLTRMLHKNCSVHSHEEYRLEFYCKECETLCCAYCLLTGPHKGHENSSMAEAATSIRTKIGRDFNLMTEKKYQLEKQVGQLNTVTTRYMDTYDDIKNSITNRFNQLRDMIKQREADIIQSLASLHETGNAALLRCRRRLLKKANAINESFLHMQLMQRGCTDYEILENKSNIVIDALDNVYKIEGQGFMLCEIGDFVLPQFNLSLDLRAEESLRTMIKEDIGSFSTLPPGSPKSVSGRPQSCRSRSSRTEDGDMVPLRGHTLFSFAEREGVEMSTVNGFLQLVGSSTGKDPNKQVGMRTEEIIENVAREHPQERGRISWRVQLGKDFDQSFIGVIERTGTCIVPPGFYWRPTKLGVVDGGLGKVGQTLNDLPVCCVGDVLTLTYSIDEGTLSINVNGKYYGNLVTSLHPCVSPCFILYPNETVLMCC
uniref:Zinc finger protein n=1 Tax=Trypanosoma congolense (strain IL3000) TaxID=1068625 RepID=G0UNV8_TRYCI|nr:conserved hypothetical protein [Trypanosoma congolense IL3000]